MTSTTDSGEASATTGAPDMPAECQRYEFWSAQLRVSPLVHVIERSARMADHTYDHDLDPETPEQTPWSVLHELVAQASYLSYGHAAVMAPGLGADNDALACASEQSVVAEPKCLEGQHIVPALPPADAGPEQLVGGAPLVAAHDAAVELILNWPHLHQDPGVIILVLHTPPNCEPGALDPLETLDPRLLERLEQARDQHDIYTMVVGVDVGQEPSPAISDGAPDGVNPHAYLNALAQAGGIPVDEPDTWYYEARDPIRVQEALDPLACEVMDCTVPIEGFVPIEDATVSVFGEPVAALASIKDCADEDGWAWTDESRVDIELCGEACALYNSYSDPCVEGPDEPALVIEYDCP